jgi:hypothetical protein
MLVGMDDDRSEALADRYDTSHAPRIGTAELEVPSKLKPVLRGLADSGRILKRTGPRRVHTAHFVPEATNKTPARDRRRPLAPLQLLQQLFGFGFVGERHARVEQLLDHRLSVGGPAEPVESHGQVILDIGAFWSRETCGTQVY